MWDRNGHLVNFINLRLWAMGIYSFCKIAKSIMLCAYWIFLVYRTGVT
jgi:hypothetical protein